MDFMARALSLAKKALGSTSPNPAVGAVIVKDGAIIGEGFTQPPGSYHAEVVALHKAGAGASGAALYVSLEPCCHWGRTPPCTRAIIAAGIKEVHMAMLDPNPLVSGKGRQELERAEIKTYPGEHKDGASQLNEAYIKYITTGLPFITAKFAMSLDGKIATASGESKWISNEFSRRVAHQLRRQADGIIVGVNTIIADDPSLTARDGKGRPFSRQPLRIVLDSQGRVPEKARFFSQPGNSLIVTGQGLTERVLKRLAGLNAEVLSLPTRDSLIDLRELIKALGHRQLTSLLVEGGSAVSGSFFDDSLVDKVIAFIAPLIIGGLEAKTAIGGQGVKSMAESLRLSRTSLRVAKGDIIFTGYLK